MKMNILITESQERMLLIESIGNELGDVVTQNENLGDENTTGNGTIPITIGNAVG